MKFQYDILHLEEFLIHDNVIVLGEYGLGKTTYIRTFLSNTTKKKIIIKTSTDYAYTFEPFRSALITYDNLNYEKNYDSLEFREWLLRHYIQLLKEGDHLFLVNNYRNLTSIQKEFLFDLLSLSQIEYKHLCNRFLIEFDGTETQLNDDKLFEFSWMFIPFNNYNIEEIKTIFYEQFNKQIIISTQNLDKIVSVARGNIVFLLKIINFLKARKTIIKENSGSWKCNNLAENSLIDIVEPYCRDKYNELNIDYQNVLDRSVAIGQEFDIDHLQIADRQITMPNEKLNYIRDNTNLIKDELNKKYKFFDYETYKAISKLVKQEKQIATYKNLSEHYKEVYKLVCEKVSISGKQTAIFRIEICDNIIKYLCRIPGYDDSLLSVCIRQIENLIVIYDYNRIADLSKFALSYMPKAITPKTLLLRKYLNNTLISALEKIASYSSALDKINQTLKEEVLSEEERFYYEYRKGVNMYAIGQSQQAYDLLLNLYSTTKNNSKYSIKLKVLLISMLSSLAEYLSLYDDCKRFFQDALDLCKNYYPEQLYTLYSMATMVQYDIKFARPLMIEALNYFKKNKNKKMTARTLHNLATDALYEALNIIPAELSFKELTTHEIFWQEAEEVAVESFETFNNFGSKDIIYPYNTYAIIQFIFKKDVKTAIIFAEKGLSYSQDHFSKITFLMLLYHLYKTDDNQEKAASYLEQFNVVAQKEDNSFFHVYNAVTNGLHFLQKKSYVESIEYFQKCFEIKNIENKHLMFSAKMLKLIATEYPEYIAPESVEEACRIKSFPLMDEFFKRQVFLGTLRFWE
jgi:hypothetical protein